MYPIPINSRIYTSRLLVIKTIKILKNEVEPVKKSLFSSHPSETFSLENHELLNMQKEKMSLKRKLALAVADSVSWLECPSHLYIVNGSRNFFIRIRAGELDEGKHYFTQINAYDLEDPNRACLFKIPITVVKPHLFDTKNSNYELEFNNVPFRQDQIYRHFERGPLDATHAEIKFESDIEDENRDHAPLFCVQTFTLEHFRSQTDSSKEEMYRLNNQNDFRYLCKVQVSQTRSLL